MDVRFVDASGAHQHDIEDLTALLDREDGFVWIDVPQWDDETTRLLSGLGCHPRVVEDCRRRNHVPTVHSYRDHYFVIAHAPLEGVNGHVHMLELDQIVGDRFLVTVHGPMNPVVDRGEALVETAAVRGRIEAGRFCPGTPAELSYALSSAVARRQRALVALVAEKLPGLEQEVMQSKLTAPEVLLERMFLIRHELITARTMAAQTHDVYARIGSLDRFVPEPSRVLARDLADQFNRVRSIADGEAQFLFGVIELYQTKVNTKMTVAMERLAVIAAITLPITALASIYGMNMIVNRSTHVTQLVIVIAVMLTMSGLLLHWAHRQGWW
ncbi:magnesium transporter CorA family protein [Nocardioides sp. CER19]|uniref:magnesium transporter CorA family protein n=1 Tax=Nocardioides sp. CER19 TaxID=3038538 RepID=UPI00244C35B7|nr:magnesium transporter CorA family protein [Nocardioides sp. CER19]MDH2415522.1 magnesium transporter CorA family protein [Nocardioides sp. CER19]